MQGILVVLLVLLALPWVEAGNCMFYFTGEGCSDCGQVTQGIQKLADKYPTAEVDMHEVYYTPGKGQLLRDLYAAHRVPLSQQGIPAAFFARSYLVGGDPIKNFAEERLLESESCPSVVPSDSVGIVGEHRSLNVFENISWSEITAGALLDAFHTGMWALVLLLLMLLGSLDRGVGVRAGLGFVAGTFFAYFLFAYGYFTWFSIGGASIFFYRLMGFLGIVYGVLIFKNFCWKWRLFHFSSRMNWLLTALVHALRSLPGMILLGGIAGAFSLHGVSATLLSMRFAFQGETGWTAVPVLLYDLLVVVLPLLVIVALFHVFQHKLDERSLRKDEKTDAWREHHRQVMHVVISLLVLFLGVVLLFM